MNWTIVIIFNFFGALDIQLSKYGMGTEKLAAHRNVELINAYNLGTVKYLLSSLVQFNKMYA